MEKSYLILKTTDSFCTVGKRKCNIFDCVTHKYSKCEYKIEPQTETELIKKMETAIRKRFDKSWSDRELAEAALEAICQ